MMATGEWRPGGSRRLPPRAPLALSAISITMLSLSGARDAWGTSADYFRFFHAIMIDNAAGAILTPPNGRFYYHASHASTFASIMPSSNTKNIGAMADESIFRPLREVTAMPAHTTIAHTCRPVIGLVPPFAAQQYSRPLLMMSSVLANLWR